MIEKTSSGPVIDSKGYQDLNSPDDHDYILTEQGTGKYADLNMVQAVALPAVAQALVTAIRARTDNGQAVAAEETTKSHDDQD